MPKKKKSQRGKKSTAANPAPGATVYTGPTRMPTVRSGETQDQFTVQLQTIGSLVADGSGKLTTVLDSFAQASSADGWSNWIALYGEYRILSIDITFAPVNKYNIPTANSVTPVFVVEDRQDSSALASTSACAGYDSVEIHQPSSTFRKIMKMDGPDEAAWISAASSPASGSRMYVKLYSETNTASSLLYYYLDRIMVQFRNRK